ncbi:hypothetical protein [Burkholderia phage vB_BpP_HN04]|nr:hypothetical protein [Burkholderia phage vB_BpP_HN01]
MSKAKPYDEYAVEGLYTIKSHIKGNTTKEWRVWVGNIKTYEQALATLRNGRNRVFESSFQLRIVGYIKEIIEDES